MTIFTRTRYIFLSTLAAIVFILSSCNEKVDRVRVIGEKIVVKKNKEGQTYFDTLSATAPSFCYQNQLGDSLKSSSLRGKIVLTDFFFTHCPSICVQMKRNMLTVYDSFKEEESVCFTSFTIDPVRDSVKTLYNYATKLGVNHKKWFFLTGQKDSIYATADRFLATAAEDENSPGGFVHDGNFILIDQRGRIRGYYNGVDEKEMPRLIKDIQLLLDEK